MRYVSFRVNSRSTYGIARDRGIVDLGARIGPLLPDLRSYLEALAAGFHPLQVPGLLEDFAADDIEYLPVCQPRKIICVGLNYEEHREETRRPRVDHPTLFNRFADTLIGHGTPIVRPQASTMLDFEGELAVVIGREAHHVPKERAMDYVAGYACFDDGSVRDWQRHTNQWLPGKSFLSTAPFGPELVTPDEVGPLDALSIETTVNGASMQRAVLGDMIFSIAELIAYITVFTRLLPGDTIATGTPGGVGFARQPPVWLKPGDTVEVRIERVGHLVNGVVDERAEGS